MNLRKIGAAFALAGSLCAAPALADTSLGAGVYYTHDGSTDTGLLGSYDFSRLRGVPRLPVHLQLSAAVPFGGGGRFAVSGEGEYRLKKFYAGAGLGIGKMGAEAAGSVMYDYFGGFRITQSTSIQGRYYGAGIGSPGSASYLGVAFGLK
jgi:hypothetical protein